MFLTLFVVVVVGFLVVVVVVEVVVVVVDVVDMAVVVEVVEADVSGEYTRMASFGLTVTVFECRRRVATVEEGTEVVVVVVVVVVVGVLILLGRLVEEDTAEGDEAGVEAGAGLVVVTGAGVEVTVTRKVTMFTSLSLLLFPLVVMIDGSSEAMMSGAASVVITDGGGGESQKSSTKGRAAGGEGLVVTAVSLVSDSSRRLSLPPELRRSTR